jgi:hypothetical protein
MFQQSVAAFDQPRTAAVQRVLASDHDHTMVSDLLFLEQWEMYPLSGSAAALRINQIRRANPELAAEVRAEVLCGRPLTPTERQALRR